MLSAVRLSWNAAIIFPTCSLRCRGGPTCNPGASAAIFAVTAAGCSGSASSTCSEFTRPGRSRSSCAQPMSIAAKRESAMGTSPASISASTFSVTVRPSTSARSSEPSRKPRRAANSRVIATPPGVLIHLPTSNRPAPARSSNVRNAAPLIASMPVSRRYSPGQSGSTAIASVSPVTADTPGTRAISGHSRSSTSPRISRCDFPATRSTPAAKAFVALSFAMRMARYTAMPSAMLSTLKSASIRCRRT